MDAVWAGSLARGNTLKCLTSAMEKESPRSLEAGHVGGAVLSSKWVKKVFRLVWKQDVSVCDVAGFPFVIDDCLPHMSCV